ncbi:DUF1622 domain-containing protein [Ktedonobacter robiniae]|uniref:DUF1622 domain-containing protein n=1 Tax=Ktedonobacter robiniae TaxID=2778365 RepID=A0ABQ3V0Z2_9CHLR|nr:DUF1622 domain-containing protein [Ktedonobacter robiniae]GHO58578.1 hypothetical protein KSB_70530 [Ktedonobacter robiniae]
MNLTHLVTFSLWAAMIEFIGALLIIAYLLRSLVVLFKTGQVTGARLIVADGIITGLSFKLAGTLLKTIELRSWRQIAMFAAIFALRTVLKRWFAWERSHLQQDLQPHNL